MVAAVLGSPFQCCVCNAKHKSLNGNGPANVCFARLRRAIEECETNALPRYYSFSPLASVLRNGERPEFNIQEYIYVLAAPSLEEAQGFLLARVKEWMEHWRKIEEEILDPNRELPPTSVEAGQRWSSSRIYFKGCSSSWNLKDKEELRLLLKDEHATYVAYAFIRAGGFPILDVQWKKIGDPGTLLFAMPDGTPILVNGKYKVKILPKGIRTVSEALAYLDGKEEP
jgi:Tfp pilus assembly protein PilZ